jgi:2-polyprenyl-3-methyl-5-hydroxy-6-metoxy-1,4-benzoquinol methylase
VDTEGGAPAENTYDQYADQYARMIDEREPGTFSPYHDLVVPCLLERAGDVTGLDVLDAGCGHGHVARILSDRGARVVAIDVSPRLIDIARAVDPETTVEYPVHDLSEPLSQYGRHFDLAVSNLVLNDVPDYEGYIVTLGRVLKPGGRGVASLSNPYSAVMRDKVEHYFDSGVAREYQDMASRGVRVYHFHRTMEEYITAFVDAGFLLLHYSDVDPRKATRHLPHVSLDRYYHLPFFTILELVRTETSGGMNHGRPQTTHAARGRTHPGERKPHR